MPTQTKKLSGVLMHPSSLPGIFSIGDLGHNARTFANQLANAGQNYWQFLPMNPVGPGNSPYSTTCSLALEELYISCEDLCTQGLVDKKHLKKFTKKNSKELCNFEKARREKKKLLEEAFINFKKHKKNIEDLKTWIKQQEFWAVDYALFEVASGIYKTRDWSTWPKPLKDRDPKALKDFETTHADEVLFVQFKQYLCDQQWNKLKSYAAKLKIKFIGDLPIFVSYESSDVWSRQHLFCLANDGTMTHVSGVPPDPFFADGQKWGTALYRWDAHHEEGYAWWIKRMQRLSQTFDLIRIDHFIGFYHYWEIPADAPTAKTGRWVKARGGDLFEAIKAKMGKVPLIAEDLGSVTQDVFDLRDRFEIPGMRVVQFGFYEGEGSLYHNPTHYIEHAVCYPGTHDNNTIAGWFVDLKNTKKHRSSYERVRAAFGSAPSHVAKAVLACALSSPCYLVISQMQDILYLDGKHRMNVPGTPTGNWRWRMKHNAFSDKKQEELKQMCLCFGRSA